MARVVVPRRRHRLRRRNVWRVAREARVDGDLDAMPVVHADPKHVVRVRHLLGLRVEVTVDRFSDNFELDLARGGGREGTRRGGGAEVSHARRRPRGGGGGEEKTRESERERERERERGERTRENERERERTRERALGRNEVRAGEMGTSARGGRTRVQRARNATARASANAPARRAAASHAENSAKQKNSANKNRFVMSERVSKKKNSERRKE